jgi:hypothetical protein
MPTTRTRAIAARTLLGMALVVIGAAVVHADQIRCPGNECETLRIRCRGAGPCVVSIATDGNRTGPYFVSVGPDIFTPAELVVVERFTNVTIVGGPGDDRVGFVDAHVPGTLRIDTGRGNDSVGWEDSGAQKLWVRTGAGNDELFFDGGGLGRRSSIGMGAGDDVVHVSSGVAGPSTIDGGGGDDAAYVDVIPFDDPPAPRITRFETLLD